MTLFDQALHIATKPCLFANPGRDRTTSWRSEEHTSELQSHSDLVCRLLLEKKKKHTNKNNKTQKPKNKHKNIETQKNMQHNHTNKKKETQITTQTPTCMTHRKSESRQKQR